jgi:hypothetical protein
MALLAEEIVEEWLNRQGFFTIRGVKVGVHEMDLLAVRPSKEGLECRQVEVQASIRPVSYVTQVPKEIRRATGRAAASAKARSLDELRMGIREWIDKEFESRDKRRVRSLLAPGFTWTRELVLQEVKYRHEVDLFLEEGIRIHRLADIVAEMHTGSPVVQGADGAHLIDLVSLGKRSAGTE